MDPQGPVIDNCYHHFVPAKDHPRVRGLDTADPYRYSYSIISLEEVQSIVQPWKANLDVPFYGITTDGTQRQNLFELQDEGAPTKEAVAAAHQILEALTSEQRAKGTCALDSEEWRKWCNPELIIYDVGLRLEHLQQSQIKLIMQLLKVSLGKDGFAKAEAAIKTNKFLGEICNSRAILNENSYFFLISGEPSEAHPWGFTFFGHHLCLNIFFVQGQMTISPVFVGAEPNVIDTGSDEGLRICNEEGVLGLELMQSLSPELQKKALIYEDMHDPAMPPGRWNPADQRHMAGAFQDNRIIPYEGTSAKELTADQQTTLLNALKAFLILLPPQVLEHRMAQIEKHLDETYFSWIGRWGPDDPFYYRIQSPVVLLEFDHHSGVFLTNEEPAKYHIHTIIRTPNGNDYSRRLIKLWRSQNQ